MNARADSTTAHWRAGLAIVLIVGGAAGVEAQTARSRFPTVLWTSCEGAAPVTLHDLAQRARPALWFSRDEPLIDINGPLPREWPRRSARNATPEDVVYYRITRVKSASSDDELARAFRERLPEPMRPHVTAGGANPEAIANVPLDDGLLRQLQEVVIRYLFYYPNELGTGMHVHDLEAVEFRVVVEQADERGNPAGKPASCRQIRVATFYGAAHGLGLYTNVLDLDIVLKDRIAEGEVVEESTSRRMPVAPGPTGVPGLPGVVAPGVTVVEKLSRSDPFWPLIVLVEEGKHASAPDRNGDGVFTPNYDVNQYSADAWGVRDTMRSRHLSPLFQADTFKKRIPELTVDDTGTLRPADSQSNWARDAFSRYVKYDYRLRRATEDREICGDPERPADERERSMKQYAKDIAEIVHGGHAEHLLAGKSFCDDTAVHSRVNAIDVFRHVSFGGAYNGFTHWWERISASLRWDGGAGWAVTLPIGVQVPGTGGWVVGRLSGPVPGQDARKSADMAFMPSASRFADWYVAAGVDYGRFESDTGPEDGQRFAFEGGMKFRFPLPSWGTFLGGRLGIRANGTGSLHNPRIVFEMGAGIW